MSEQEYPYDISVYKEKNKLLMVPLIKHIYGYHVRDSWGVVMDATDDVLQIGEGILHALIHLKNSPKSTLTPRELQENAAWKKYSTYKTWKAFWKHNLFSTVRLKEDGSFWVSSSIRANTPMAGYNKCVKIIELSANAAPEDIGEALMEVFHAVEEYYDIHLEDKCQRKEVALLNESVLSFTAPKDRHFEDSEDMGAMECYQSYSYIAKEGDEPSAVFFFSMAPEIDCDLSFENVKQSWEACYEIAEIFEMKEKQKGMFTHCAELKNKSVYKKSYFLKQEEDLFLECGMVVYQPNRRKKLCEKLDGMFEEFALSCKQVEE